MAPNNQNQSFSNFTRFLKERYNLTAIVVSIISGLVPQFLPVAYKSQAVFLSFFSFLVCCVCIWLIFSLRERIIKLNFLQYIFIIIGVLCGIFYYSFLGKSISQVKVILSAAENSQYAPEAFGNLKNMFGQSIANQIKANSVDPYSNSFILGNAQTERIPHDLILLVLFIAILLCFESIFILLALKDFVRSDRQNN